MKSLKTVLAIALSTVGLGSAVALGAVANNKENNSIQIADATDTITLYVNLFDGGGNWNNFSYYLFGGSAGENAPWPGVSFTDEMKTPTPNEYDQYQYVLNIDTTKYAKLNLVGNPANWGGSQAQTEDLVISDMSNNGLYCGGQIPDSNKFEVGYYGYTTKTIYMLDLKGDVFSTNHYAHVFATGKSGTTWPGVAMKKVAGTNNIYSADINSALDNVIFNNNTSVQTETINGLADGDAFITYPNNGYNKIELDAVRFIDQYMKFETAWLDDEGTGKCSSLGWFSSARTAFEGLTNDEKADILEHEPTKDRFAAWAAANSVGFNPSTGVFSSNRLGNLIIEDKNTTLVIIVSVAIALSTTGLFFLLRKKRKEQ